MATATHTLILLTNHFPYNTGETFIDSEMPFLTAAFEKVLVVTREKNPQSVRPNRGDFGFYRINPQSSWSEKLMVPWLLLTKLRTVAHLVKTEKKGLKAAGKKITGHIRKTIRHDLFKALVTAHHVESIMKVNRVRGKTVLYSYWMNNSALATQLVKVKNVNLTTVSRGHGSDIYEYLNKAGYLGYRYALMKTLDAVFTISDFGKNHLSKYLPVNCKERIFVSRLGTFPITVQNEPETPGFVIASCSNIIPLKRLHYIIGALEKINDLSVTWVHLGDGPDREKMEKLAQEKLSGKVNISYQFTGQISNLELRHFYSTTRIDLFVNSSSTEGIPVSIMEALSCGVPVMAFDVGGVSEIVKDTYGKLLSPSEGPEQMAVAIHELLSADITKKKSMRKNAIEHWEKNYNAEINYRNFTQKLLSLSNEKTNG